MLHSRHVRVFITEWPHWGVITLLGHRGQRKRKHSCHHFSPLSTAAESQFSQPQGKIKSTVNMHLTNKTINWRVEYLLCWHLELHELSLSTQNVPRRVDLQEADSKDLTLKNNRGLDIKYSSLCTTAQTQFMTSQNVWTTPINNTCLVYRWEQTCCFSVR